MSERSSGEPNSLKSGGQISPVVRGYSPLQQHFLSRLSFLIRQRDDVPEAWLGPILSRVIYSTFQDCLSLEMGSEARAIIRGEAFKVDEQATP